MRSTTFRGIAAAAVVAAMTLSAFSQTWDMARMDPSVAACDNFYKYANGRWLKNTPIPAAFPSWGTWDILITHNREQSRDILENDAKSNAPRGSSAQLIGDYYASCMDEAGIEAAGSKPLEPYLKEIDAIKDISGRPEYARLNAQTDPHSLSEFRVNGPLSNFQPFAEAFGCKVGNKMIREKQCQVW